jgi:hypothetical protein
MNFSAILDISSFFIGMIINLLLIALICYYFKRKYENLEIAQNEQAKVLYQLLQQNVQPKVKNLSDIIKDKEWELSKSSISDSKSDSDSESDSESDSDSVSECANTIKFVKTTDTPDKITDMITETKIINLDEIEEISLDEKKKIEVKYEVKYTKSDANEVKNELKNELKLDVKIDDIDEKDYSKMTIKQLKEILSVKGINANKLKKVEMIDLIEKSTEMMEIEHSTEMMKNENFTEIIEIDN